MVTWTLAKKDLRLLLRDRRAFIVLLAMPFIFILVLGLILGEGFGQSPDDRLRVYVVNQDQGYLAPAPFREGMAWFMAMPAPGPLACESQVASAVAFQQASSAIERMQVVREVAGGLAMTPDGCGLAGAFEPNRIAGLALMEANRQARAPRESWASVVLRDLEQTGGIKVQMLASQAEAEDKVANSRMSAVLIFGPDFSERVSRCSFLAGGINPFYRDGVKLQIREAGKPPSAAKDMDALDVELLRDPTQLSAASIIEQVAQVALLRVVLPWMIGRAFEKMGERDFLELLSKEIGVPAPLLVAKGVGVQNAIQKLFPKYNLTAKTWASLTKSDPKLEGVRPGETRDVKGSGFLNRGALKYQFLVPSYTVMFAFFLVLTVGWLFVGERRQGTLKRLQAAPLSRAQILVGKMAPCLLLSLAQGFLLLIAGRVVFGMDWGPKPWLLIPVVVATSLAAMGLALVVATLARTETQVAIYGTFLVLVLAMVSGCLLPRDFLGEIQHIRHFTPHAWALDAYNQLLLSPAPNEHIVWRACGVLAGFGTGFIGLAWSLLRLD